MPLDDAALRVTVTVDTAQLKAGMAESVATTKTAAAEMATATAAIAPAASTASASIGGMAGATAKARTEFALLDGSTGMMASGLARVAAQSQTLAPLITAAFPLVAGLAFVALISSAIGKIDAFEDEVRKASAQAADFAIESYKGAESVQLENLRIESQIQMLEGVPKSNSLSIALLEAKVAADTLGKSLETDTQKTIELLNVGALGQLFTSASGDEEQFQDRLQEILGKVQDARLKLATAPPGSDAAKAAIEDQIDAYAQFGKQIDADIAALKGQAAWQTAQSGGLLPRSVTTSIAKLKDLKINATEAGVSLREMIQQGDLRAKAGALQDQNDALAESIRLEKDAADGLRQMREDAAKSQWPSSFVVGTLPDESIFTAYYAKIADDATASYAKIREAEALSGPMPTDDSATAIAFEKDLQERGKLWGDEQKKETEAQQKAADAQEKIVDAMTKRVEHNFESSFDGVIRGTETVKFAFIKLGGDLVMDAAHAGEQMLAKFVATEAQKVAAAVIGEQQMTVIKGAGESQRAALEEVAFVKAIARDAEKVAVYVGHEVIMTASTVAGVGERVAVQIAEHVAIQARYAAEAAGAAFASAAAIPIIGPFIAPAAAAGAFAAVMAFEGGGLTDRVTAAVLHPQEMVLPSHIAQPLIGAVPSLENFNRAMSAPAGAGSSSSASRGGDTHNHNNFTVNALDAQSVEGFLHRNQGSLTRLAKNIVRNSGGRNYSWQR